MHVDLKGVVVPDEVVSVFIEDRSRSVGSNILFCLFRGKNKTSDSIEGVRLEL